MRPLTAASLTAMWLVSVWLIASGDPIRESILGVALREDVSFAVGFSEPAFRSVEPGMSDQTVRGLLGPPHDESWYYPPRDQPALRAADASVAEIRGECLGVRFEWGFAVNSFDEHSCGKLGLWIRHVARRCPASPRTSARSVLEVHLESNRRLLPRADGLLPELACGRRPQSVVEGRVTISRSLCRSGQTVRARACHRQRGVPDDNRASNLNCSILFTGRKTRWRRVVETGWTRISTAPHRLGPTSCMVRARSGRLLR